jgi:hypothetical protein
MMWFNDVMTSDDERAVALFMSRLASTAPPEAGALPEADVVWLRAQLLRQWDAERIVQAPLDLMEPLQIAAGLAAAAVLLMWSLPSLMRSLTIFAP